MKDVLVESVRYRAQFKESDPQRWQQDASAAHILDFSFQRAQQVQMYSIILFCKALLDHLGIPSKMSGFGLTLSIQFESEESAIMAWPIVLRLLP